MLKKVKSRVWAFDAEWVPDPLAGRLLYDIPDSVEEPEKVLEVMWKEGGASEEDPTPFLKLVLCRLVSIAAVERRVRQGGEVVLHLLSLPHDPEDPAQCREAAILGTFLESLGTHRPQLVGFNSVESDLRIMVQRGVVLGLQAAGFCARPEKPWEGIDYFARGSDWNVDLREMLAGFGKGGPSLHEVATLSGIPGKMEIDGNRVAGLWLEGDLRQIVQYNEMDALTTYLLWLRLAHFAGHFDAAAYLAEQERVRLLIEEESAKPARAHLKGYADEWERLRRATGQA